MLMFNRGAVHAAICLLTIGALLSAQGSAPQAGGSSVPLDARIDAIVQNEILAKGIPSVSVAVMRDGQMLLQRAWGVSDITTAVKADASTTYQIASASKQFTAALVLKQ